MKIRLILVSNDRAYTEAFLEGSTQKRDSFELSVCNNYEKLGAMLRSNRYDVCLAAQGALDYVDPAQVKMLLQLWDQKQDDSGEAGVAKVRKYQRISSILAEVQGHLATVVDNFYDAGAGKVTAVWSPAGGTGKSSVAVAYAARAARSGKKVAYLGLELFSGTEALFGQQGKSLSTVLDELGGNLALRMQSVAQTDNSTNIQYFSPASNYDDMNELTAEDMLELIKAAAQDVDELVVDLSSVCDRKTASVFENADSILLVTDGSPVSAAKMRLFVTQNGIFRDYCHKMKLVANKGSKAHVEDLPTVCLPFIKGDDPVHVYMSLSEKEI